jgi:hypothetical protein
MAHTWNNVLIPGTIISETAGVDAAVAFLRAHQYPEDGTQLIAKVVYLYRWWLSSDQGVR